MKIVNNKKLKIAIDIDDCMCNTVDIDFAYGYYYSKQNNIFQKAKIYDSTYYYVPTTFGFNDKQTYDFFVNEKKYIMKHTAMYPFSFVKEVINCLYKNCIIIILTSRENKYWNNNAYKYAKKWLKKYKIKFDKLFVQKLNKGEFCKQNNIDLLIEDNLNYVKSANELGIKTILLKKEYNKEYVNKNNNMALNWLHLFDLINETYFNNNLKIKI